MLRFIKQRHLKSAALVGLLALSSTYGSAMEINIDQGNQAVHTFGDGKLLGQTGENKQLKSLLQELDGYQSGFEQIVRDTEGNVIHKAKGSMLFSQPGKFVWEVTEPEEELLISNGKYVWWYNPFVEQVSIYDANSAVTTTPFALLVNDDPNVWKNFRIQTLEQGFVITPVDLDDAQVIQLELKTDQSRSKIETILITSRSRQVSEYILFDQTKVSPTKQRFEFEIPIGVDIDDQRQSNN